ncbi:PAS domain-containing protein [Halorarius halobius]|uniref:PAS domain-containing protein n=1 Tax=Halorarius halobius TaxID=2962671 RepID=UPI0020CE73A3|nr:PAS domain S-box protein [Halorarius halobius]
MSDAAQDGESREAVRSAYEAAVSKQRARFQALVEHLPSAIALLDASGEFQFLSPSVEDVTGHRPEQLLGENAFDYIHPDDRARVEEVFARGLAEPNRLLTAEYRYLHADDHWIHVESRGHNRLDDPAVEGFVVNTRDVTRERKARQQFQQERDLNRGLLEVAPQPMVVVDGDGVVRRANDAAQDAFDVGADEVVGLHPENDARTAAGQNLIPPGQTVSARVRETGEPVEGAVHEWLGPDGDRFRVTVDAAPLVTDGEVRRVVLAFQDVQRL